MRQRPAVCRCFFFIFLFFLRILLYLHLDVTSDDLPEVEFADWSESKKLLVTTVVIKCAEYLQKEDRSAATSEGTSLMSFWFLFFLVFFVSTLCVFSTAPSTPRSASRMQLKGLFLRPGNPNELKKIRSSYEQIEDKIFNVLGEVLFFFSFFFFLVYFFPSWVLPFFFLVQIDDPFAVAQFLLEVLKEIPYPLLTYKLGPSFFNVLSTYTLLS